MRGLVRDCYKAGGRPSIDPVVLFKTRLQHLLIAAALNVARLAAWCRGYKFVRHCYAARR